MPKEIKYASVADKFLNERSLTEMVHILITILDAIHPGFFEKGVNKLFPSADKKPYTATTIKPQ